MARRKKTCITKLEIKQMAARMFMENGYYSTTLSMVSQALRISVGNLTFHFPTKEHLLMEVVKDLMLFHMKIIDRVLEDSVDNLHAYCREVVMQIVLCEAHPQAKELYLALYSHPNTLALVKEWSANKNYLLLSSRLTEWNLERFRLMENAACCIERGALTEPCSEHYTLEDKLRLTMDCLMKLYEVPAQERERVIRELLETDYLHAGDRVLEEFTEYMEQVNRKEMEEALQRGVWGQRA